MFMLRRWEAPDVMFTGEIASDPIQQDTLGAAFSGAIPYVGDTVLPDNVQNYNVHTMVELVKMVYRRLDIYLSKDLPVFDFPLSIGFADALGFEDIRPLKVLVPNLPVAFQNKVHFPFSMYFGSFVAAEFTVWADYDCTLECSFVSDDNSFESVQLSFVAEDGWQTCSFAIPTASLSNVAKTVKIGITQTASPDATLLQIGRVSMKYAVNEIPAPQFPTE